MAEPAEQRAENTEEPMQQQRQVAVITGASSGIGMATALEFARHGYDVVLAARRKKELEQTARQCQEHGVNTLVVPTDTTDDTAVHSLAEAAIQHFHHIDVWVNDAGVYLTGTFQDVPLEDMRRVFDTNFFGYVHGSHAALTEFRRTGHGTLINISSVNAAAPQPYVGIYSASKAAVRALDESLRMELRIDGLQDDIHVCTVMPASIDTNIFQNAANYTGREVQAIEPVYDPAYVAKQIVSLARRPRREIIVGPAGKLMAIQNAHMPARYEKQISKFTKNDLIGNKPAVMTDGNLFESVETNRGMRGGWREKRTRADHLNAGIGLGLLAAAGLAAGIGYAIFKNNQKDGRPMIAERSNRLLHTLFS
jgi:short-subunit dehydrogenase